MICIGNNKANIDDIEAAEIARVMSKYKDKYDKPVITISTDPDCAYNDILHIIKDWDYDTYGWLTKPEIYGFEFDASKMLESMRCEISMMCGEAASMAVDETNVYLCDKVICLCIELESGGRYVIHKYDYCKLGLNVKYVFYEIGCCPYDNGYTEVKLEAAYRDGCRDAYDFINNYMGLDIEPDDICVD